MADAVTPILGLVKPEVAASRDTWGAKLNANSDILDGARMTAVPVPWGDVSGKPSTFTPSAHNHPQSEITNLVTDLAAKLPTASYTAADVLTKIKTVDGTTSGLDADLLDGLESTAFATAASVTGKQDLDATLTALAGLNATAGLVEQTAADAFTKRLLGVGAATSVPTRADADGRYAALVHTHAQSDITNLVTDLAAKLPTTSYTAADVLAKMLTVDGAGSLLDADFLDGNSSAFYATASSVTAKQDADATLTALAGLNTTAGMVVQTGTDTFAKRTLTGTANRLTVTNGDGASANPTFDISTAYVGQATITTLGTIGTGVWQGTVVGVTYGGTGASTAAGARTNLGLVIGTDVAAQSHTHVAANVSDFAEAVDDRVSALLIAGTNITLSYNDVGNALTINSTGGGAATTISDTPPGSPVPGQLWWESDTGLLFIWYDDGTSQQWVAAAIGPAGPAGADGSSDWADITGKPSTFAPSAHVHPTSEVTGLDTALTGKAAAVHTHVRADITDLYIQNTAVYDPPSMTTNTVGTIQTMTVTGAALGDFVIATFTLDLQGISLWAWVSAANTVSYQFWNRTAGTINLSSGVVRCRVIKWT